MKRKYSKSVVRGNKSAQKRGLRQPALAQARQVQLPLGVEGLVELARESLASFATEMGLKIAECLLEDEVTRRCGARHERPPERNQTRHGHQSGFVTIAGQKVSVVKPRGRCVDGGGEVALDNYTLLQSPDAMPEAALRRMVHGVSCRRYEHVVDVAREGFGVKKSSVSRGFVRASANQVPQLAERRFDDERFAVIFIDGQPYAGEMMVVALGITVSGEKHLLGVRQGATENAAVCTALLADLRDRGVSTTVATLFVLDGAKALRAAVSRVGGRFAVVQRCQVHKRRHVEAHLPKKHHDELRRQLNLADHETDHDRARTSLGTTVQWLRRLNPDAAASLEEGLAETLTVVRLKIPELLRKTVATTNPIESTFSVAESVTRRVKHWRDGDMRHRWCVAGLLDAESRFRRVKGYRHLPSLIRALELEIAPPSLDAHRKRA